MKTRREAIRYKAPPSPYAPFHRAFEVKLPTLKVEQSFYETDAWRDLRYRALARSNGQCELCGSSKRSGAILHVDHIKPRSRFPELELSLGNLQVLCADCNLGKSNRCTRDWRATAHFTGRLG